MVRVVIADDHPLVAEFLRVVCCEQLGFEVAGEAATGGQAVDVIRRTQPDLILLDLNLPGFNGFEVIAAVRRTAPVPAVVVLSGYCTDHVVRRLDRLGVRGFICKSEPPSAIREAIVAVASGRAYFSPRFLNLKSQMGRDPRDASKLLTPREIEVLMFIGDGGTDAEIARDLGIDQRTVEKHRLNLTAKLDFGERVELQQFARQRGFYTRFEPPA